MQLSTTCNTQPLGLTENVMKRLQYYMIYMYMYIYANIGCIGHFKGVTTPNSPVQFIMCPTCPYCVLTW